MCVACVCMCVACVRMCVACVCMCPPVHANVWGHTVIPFLLILEVAADDTPAVDAVLKADTKRLELLEEVRPVFRVFRRGCF